MNTVAFNVEDMYGNVGYIDSDTKEFINKINNHSTLISDALDDVKTLSKIEEIIRTTDGPMDSTTAKLYIITTESVSARLGIPIYNPALEHFTNKYTKETAHSIALETVGSFIMDVLRAIKKAIATVINFIRYFFTSLFSESANKQDKEKLKKLDENIKQAEKKMENGTILAPDDTQVIKDVKLNVAFNLPDKKGYPAVMEIVNNLESYYNDLGSLIECTDKYREVLHEDLVEHSKIITSILNGSVTAQQYASITDPILIKNTYSVKIDSTISAIAKYCKKAENIDVNSHLLLKRRVDEGAKDIRTLGYLIGGSQLLIIDTENLANPNQNNKMRYTLLLYPAGNNRIDRTEQYLRYLSLEQCRMIKDIIDRSTKSSERLVYMLRKDYSGNLRDIENLVSKITHDTEIIINNRNGYVDPQIRRRLIDYQATMVGGLLRYLNEIVVSIYLTAKQVIDSRRLVITLVDLSNLQFLMDATTPAGVRKI